MADEIEPRADRPWMFGSRPEPVLLLWAWAVHRLTVARNYWIATTRLDDRPHSRPVWGVWLDGAFYFSTGPDEQKARNMLLDSRVAVVTGRNDFARGLDVILEGEAERVRETDTVQLLAKTLNEKYDDYFGFVAQGVHFTHDAGGVADLFVVTPTKAFAYGRGDNFGATRYALS